MLYGAVIGDVLGSTFEFNNWLKSPEELPIFPPDAHPTDDSVLTCAVADALIASAVRDDVSEHTLRVDPVQFQTGAVHSQRLATAVDLCAGC